MNDRHATLMHHASRLRGEGLGAKAIRAALEDLQERFTEPTGRRGEIDGIVRWVMGKEAPPPIDSVDVELLHALDGLPETPPRDARSGATEATKGDRAGGDGQPRDASWERPVPLTGRDAAPRFEIALLPGWLADWSNAIAAEKGAALDLGANLALGVISGAIARNVQVSPRPGWYEPTNL